MNKNDERRVIRLQETRDKLDEVSPSMCLAKWLQVTVHLHNGFTHSCHHPVAHKIPLAEIEANPMALHNTKQKMAARADMLNGVQTSECDYCWKIENLGKGNISDRTMKSSMNWALPRFKEVVDSGTGENIFPSYMEVSFENTCNFRCLYCSPEISSRWMEDIQRNGKYVVGNEWHNNLEYLKDTGRFPYAKDEHNPYVEAFWKLWPKLKSELITFRITGGEPLLSKNTWMIMEDLIENPQPKLDLSINTNLGVPDKLIDRFIENIKKLNGKVDKITVFTSAEGDGQDQEFCRDGIIMTNFWHNVYRILDECPNVVLVYMTTINVFSVDTLDVMVDKALRQRAEYPRKFWTPELVEFYDRVLISFNYLRHPSFMSLQILNEEKRNSVIKHWTAKIEEFKTSTHERSALTVDEAESWTRILNWMSSSTDQNSKESSKFKEYIQQIEHRRGTICPDKFFDYVTE